MLSKMFFVASFIGCLFFGYFPNNYLMSDEDVVVPVESQVDETKVIKGDDGTIIKVAPDGSKFIQVPEGTLIEKWSDGSKVIKKPDGTTIQINPDGSKVIQKADGETIRVEMDD